MGSGRGSQTEELGNGLGDGGGCSKGSRMEELGDGEGRRGKEAREEDGAGGRWRGR